MSWGNCFRIANLFREGHRIFTETYVPFASYHVLFTTIPHQSGGEDRFHKGLSMFLALTLDHTLDETNPFARQYFLPGPLSTWHLDNVNELSHL